MRIIRLGARPGEEKACVSCMECTTEFEVMKNECTLIASPRFGDDYYEVKCPHCDERVTISPRSFR